MSDKNNKYFSNDDDERLVEIVSRYTLLWNSSDPDYKNNSKRYIVWSEIGSALNKTGEQCKTRWRNIRDNFQRHKKELTTGSGKPTRKKRATYWERLGFLDNIDDDWQECVINDVQSLCGASDIPVPTNSYNFLEEDSVKSNDWNDLPSGSGAEKVGASGYRSDLVLTKIQKKANHDSELFEPMNELKEGQTNLVRRIEKHVAPKVVEEDEMDVFLRSMALTMKQFTPLEKAEAKRQIFKIVSDIELKHLTSANMSVENDQAK